MCSTHLVQTNFDHVRVNMQGDHVGYTCAHSEVGACGGLGPIL